MIIDGKKIAEGILEELSQSVSKLDHKPSMVAITCAPNFETKKYLELKKAKAGSIGVSLNVVELPEDSNTDQVVECVRAVSEQTDGIVVQLPLPEHINRDVVLAAVSRDKDPDSFAYGEKNDRFLPPVVGAIHEISLLHKIEWKNKKVVVLGQGRLVGLPVARYARKCGAKVRVYEEGTLDVSSLKTADIIVSGIGQPGFITADMVSDGVVVFDAGTSEDGGELVGDVRPEVASKAALLTPVPGGIGPITIAYLLKNLVTLATR